MLNSKSISAGFVKEFCYVFISFLSWIFVGISRSYPAFLFTQLESPDSSISVSTDEKSWIASITYLFNPVGCVLSGVLTDIIGRKLCVQLVFVPLAICWAIMSYAKDIQMIYVGMMFQGIGGGMACGIASYISEISIAQHRGGLLALMEVKFSFGILLCNLLMYYFNWNVVSFVFVIFAVFALLLTFLLPESPIWLLLKGNREQSIKVLCSLRSKAPKQLEYEIRDMERTCELLSKKKSFLNNFSSMIKAWRPFAILFLLALLGMGTGNTLLFSYMVIILDKMDIPYESTKIVIAFSTVLCVTSFLAPIFVNKYGRKVILATSTLGMSVSIAMVAAYMEIFHDDSTKPYAWIVPVLFCTYAFFCCIGIIPIGFIMGGELFPREISGTMNGLCGFCVFMYMSLAFKLYPSFLAQFGVRVSLWMFSFFSLVMVAFAILVLPETKGRTLNEIQTEYFAKKRRMSKTLYTVTI